MHVIKVGEYTTYFEQTANLGIPRLEVVYELLGGRLGDPIAFVDRLIIGGL